METEIPQKTENQEKKRKRTRFTPSVIFNFILIFGVLAVIALVLYAPKADFFKGALILRSQTGTVGQVEGPREDQMPGAILIDYVTKNNEIAADGKLITLTSFILEVEYEEMDVSSFLFEFEGNLKEGSIEGVKLLIDSHELENSNYVWISPNRLLVELSKEDVLLKKRSPITLQGALVDVEKDQTIMVIVSDISATGLALNKAITNIGVKGDTDVVGTALYIQK